MNKKISITLIIGLIWLQCARESPDTGQTLASIGTAKVTVDEFQRRFEFAPKIFRYGNATENKIHFLASLLSEKALAQFARDISLDTLTSVAERTNQFEKEALVEALFDQEVAQKIKLSEDAIRRAWVRSKQELALQYFMVSSENEAGIAGDQLARGEAFDKVAALHLFHSTAKSDSVPVKILKWGEALPAVEDSVFSLKHNQFCGPLQVDHQYFFFKLVDKKSQVMLTENDFHADRPSIEKRLRKRLRGQRFNQFITQLLQDTRVTVPAKKFNFLASELEVAMNVPEQSARQAGVNDSRQLVGSDFLNVQTQLAENLKEPFIAFSDGRHWTIGAFLERLRVGPYPLNFDSKAKFRASLRHTIKFMIELEQLAAEGRKRGLAESAFVQEETRMWQDYLLADAAQKILLDQKIPPTDETLKKFFQENLEKYTTPELVKIQEILVNNRNQAAELRGKIQNGADMAQLARKFSLRKQDAERGGISGFFREGSRGIVGQTAFESEVGKLVGPVETAKKQYSIFRVLEKKAARVPDFAAVKSEVARDYQQHLLGKVVQEQSLAVLEKYPLQINSALLDSLHVLDQGAGMLVLKQHFPGRSAVPFVLPADQQTAWQERIYRAYLQGK